MFVGWCGFEPLVLVEVTSGGASLFFGSALEVSEPPRIDHPVTEQRVRWRLATRPLTFDSCLALGLLAHKFRNKKDLRYAPCHACSSLGY